jgi:cytochrome c-type biogenesis protein CcmH/NrfF
MADIDVVPKRSSHLWMWIVIAIVLLAVIWAVVGRRSNTNTPQGQLHEPHHQRAPIALLAMRT